MSEGNPYMGHQCTHRVVVKMVKVYLCLLRGSKSFLLSMAGLAEERTPTSRSGEEKPHSSTSMYI